MTVESTKRLVVVLTFAALLSWIGSLALPGFVVDSRAGSMQGSQILVSGLLFGWANIGWAAYANLFFLYVAFQLLRGRQPKATVVAMLLLAATLPFFSGIQRDEGTSVVLPIVSWGWGAVLWTISLIVVASAAAVRTGVIAGASIKLLGVGIIGILAALIYVHQRQWQAANMQEREMYLPAGVAFTNGTFSHLPFVWPDGPVVPSDAVFSLDVEPDLFSAKKDDRPRLELPKLPALRLGGFDWYTLEDPYLSQVHVKVRKVASAATKVIQFEAKRTKEGAVIRINDADSKTALYEQRFGTIWRKEWQTQFFPTATNGWWEGLAIGYDRAINRALGLYDKRELKARVALHPEVAHTACNIGSENVDGIDGLRVWDGRHAMVNIAFQKVRVGFCSESYIGLVYVNEHLQSNPSAQNVRFFVTVFDRETLMPTASFVEHVKCPAQCKDTSPLNVSGVRISDEAVVIETTQETITAERNLPSKDRYHLYYK